MPVKTTLQKLTLSYFFVTLLLISLSPPAHAEKGRSGQVMFDTAEEALEALKTALKSADNARLSEMFGKDSRDLFFTGDTAGDAVVLRRLSKRFEQRAELFPVKSSDFKNEQWYLIRYGIEGWDLHIPLVNRGKGWNFATEYASQADLKIRRALNEVATVDTLRALVKAQAEYKARDRNGDGILEFAQKFNSSPGNQDGLYWPAKDEAESSPIDGIVSQALDEGYTHNPKGIPTYYGYKYKILNAQGGMTLGGEKSYLKDGRLVNGFAILAYPVEWKVSGDATFVVAADGQVWKKDFSSRTKSIASNIKSMELDQDWIKVDSVLGGDRSRSNW